MNLKCVLKKKEQKIIRKKRKENVNEVEGEGEEGIKRNGRTRHGGRTHKAELYQKS